MKHTSFDYDLALAILKGLKNVVDTSTIVAKSLNVKFNSTPVLYELIIHTFEDADTQNKEQSKNMLIPQMAVPYIPRRKSIINTDDFLEAESIRTMVLIHAELYSNGNPDPYLSFSLGRESAVSETVSGNKKMDDYLAKKNLESIKFVHDDWEEVIANFYERVAAMVNTNFSL